MIEDYVPILREEEFPVDCVTALKVREITLKSEKMAKIKGDKKMQGIKKNKKVIVFSILVFSLISLVTFYAFSFFNGEKDNSLLTKAVVLRKDLSLKVQATGIIKPMIGAEVKVGSRISGKLEHLYANVGGKVNKGDIIAELEQDELKAGIQEYEAELKEALTNLSAQEMQKPIEIRKEEAILARALSQFELAKKELERQNELYLKEITSLQNLDKAKSAMEMAEKEYQSDLESLKLVTAKNDNSVKSLKAHIELIKVELNKEKIKHYYSIIKAPISGVIASVSTQEGETVSVGLNAPTFVTIIDLLKLQVDAYVDETDIGRVKIGQKAYFSVDTYSDKDFEGIVEAIHPKAIIQDNVVYYDVVIKIVSPEKNLLRPEMTANVNIAVEDRKNVLAIPSTAVKKEGGKKFCYLLKGEKIEKRDIRTGVKDSQYTEVVGGLRERDIVILENSSLQPK